MTCFHHLFELQAESLVKAQQDIGETMGELGLVFVKLTKFETEEGVFISQKTRARDMKNMATSSVKASRLYRELNGQTIKHLVISLYLTRGGRMGLIGSMHIIIFPKCL